MRPPRKYTGFSELVEAGARERGCQVAFVHERAGRVEGVTWNDFAARVQARAAELRGDARACEAVFADGSLACIVEVFACAEAGIQVVLAAADVPEQEASELVAAGDADAVWPPSCAVGEVREALRGDDERIERPGFGRILFFTSGTTSRAKPVALTDTSLMASAYNGSALLPLGEVLQMATVNGAKLQGRGDTGALAVGQKADIIAVDMDRPHLTPCIDPLSNLLFSAQAADVCLTMADGKILYENGAFLTLDRDRILHEARRAAARLLG